MKTRLALFRCGRLHRNSRNARRARVTKILHGSGRTRLRRPRGNALPILHTKDGTNLPARTAASRLGPIRRIRIRSSRPSRRLRTQRTTRRQAPTSGNNRDMPRPALATRPNCRHKRTSGHSDKAPSPTAHRKPTSSRSRAPKPSVPRDRAPNPDRSCAESTPDHSPGSRSRCRRNPYLPSRCSSDWCGASSRRSQFSYRDRCSRNPIRLCPAPDRSCIAGCRCRQS